MKRVPCIPRAGWQDKVSATGLTYHSPIGKAYWNESFCYEFTPGEISILQNAALEIQSLCEQAMQAIVERGLWRQLGLDEKTGAEIAVSWKQRDHSILGRLDLAWDGEGSPKLLEYNADTPMALIEASLTQRQWLEDTMPTASQWNNIHGALTTAWQKVTESKIHFTGFIKAKEDEQTLRYLAKTEADAGKETVLLSIERLGWHRMLKKFADNQRNPIERIFKLYPWEWLWTEGFARHPEWPRSIFVEPIWKMAWNSKGILAILWELFPDHPNLLPCYQDPAPLQGNYVRKPKRGREGCNIEYFRDGQCLMRTPGPYTNDGFTHQALAPATAFDGNYSTLGVWMVDGRPQGLGIREDSKLIVSDNSCFIPHRVLGG